MTSAITVVVKLGENDHIDKFRREIRRVRKYLEQIFSYPGSGGSS